MMKNTKYINHRNLFVSVAIIVIFYIKNNKDKSLMQIIENNYFIFYRNGLAYTHKDFKNFKDIYNLIFKSDNITSPRDLKNVIELLHLYQCALINDCQEKDKWKDITDSSNPVHKIQGYIHELLNINDEDILTRIISAILIMVIGFNTKSNYCISTPKKWSVNLKAFKEINYNISQHLLFDCLFFKCLLYSDLLFYGFDEFFSEKIKEYSAFSYVSYISQKNNKFFGEKTFSDIAEDILTEIKNNLNFQYNIRKLILESKIDCEMINIKYESIEKKLKTTVYGSYDESALHEQLQNYIKKGIPAHILNYICEELAEEFEERSFNEYEKGDEYNGEVFQNIADIFNDIDLNG